MIYVIMHGRLGNQFFQYAFAKRLQMNRPDDKIAIYFGRVQDNNKAWSNDLEHFKSDDYDIISSMKEIFRAMSFWQKCTLAYYLFRCRLIKDADKLMEYQTKSQRWLNREGLYWLRNGKFEPLDSSTKNVFVCGHFEHYSLYEGMENQLRSLLLPKYDLCENNKELYKAICDSESVCISIRRGDYLTASNKSTYFVCDKEYFDKAIEEIKKRVPNATLFLFSDDTEWIRQNFSGENVYYETHNNPIWEKVRLMSACKHFVISNSTFSWWMQFLSSNNDKVVISPNRWKNTSSYKGLISPSFITIDV